MAYNYNMKEKEKKKYRSRILFSARVIVEEVTESKTIKGAKETRYWKFKDRGGNTFFCYDLQLAESISLLEPYEIKGQVVCRQGGTFLTMEEATLSTAQKWLYIENRMREIEEEEQREYPNLL